MHLLIFSRSEATRPVSIRSEEGYEPGFQRLYHCSWSEGSGMAWYAPAFESLSAGSLRFVSILKRMFGSNRMVKGWEY